MEKSHPIAAVQYAQAVVDGETPAGKFNKLACERFLADLERDDIHFDEVRAQRACNFIETLHHVKGRWAAKKERIKLHRVQSFIICNLFGFLDEDGDRRFTEAYVEKPRKNAKSTLAAGIGLYMLCEDGEHAAEVYSGATSEKQAWEVYGSAHRMAKVNVPLQERYSVEVNARSLIVENTFSKFVPLIGKPGDGANVHCALVDEYHEHLDDSMVDTMRQGIGSRTSPLIFKITTAGDNLNGPCYEHRQFAQSVLEGTAEADHLFVCIFHADEDDDWDSVEALEKANPLLDVSKNRKLTLAELAEARRSARKQGAYRTKHLNEWIGAANAWMNMLAWQRQKRDMDVAEYHGAPAYMAVDLAAKKDAVAICVAVPSADEFKTFSWFFAPEGAAENNDKYRDFAISGDMVLTPGAATDFEAVEEKIVELARFFDVRGLAFDEWQAMYMMQRLANRGLEPIMKRFPQTRQYLSDPMKRVDALIADGKLWHDGNKCMTWMMGNVMSKEYGKDVVVPIKARPNDPRCKIDGPVTLIMAMGMADRGPGPSVDDWLREGPISI